MVFIFFGKKIVIIYLIYFKIMLVALKSVTLNKKNKFKNCQLMKKLSNISV